MACENASLPSWTELVQTSGSGKYGKYFMEYGKCKKKNMGFPEAFGIWQVVHLSHGKEDPSMSVLVTSWLSSLVISVERDTTWCGESHIWCCDSKVFHLDHVWLSWSHMLKIKNSTDFDRLGQCTKPNEMKSKNKKIQGFVLDPKTYLHKGRGRGPGLATDVEKAFFSLDFVCVRNHLAYLRKMWAPRCHPEIVRFSELEVEP